MTYQELKTRLSKCETTLQDLKDGSYKNITNAAKKSKIAELILVKESLTKRLNEAEDKGVIYTDDEKQAEKLAAGGSNVKITKEEEGMKFSVEETKTIARSVGKAVAMGLKNLGDEVGSMKAKNIEENSFEIYVEYKNDRTDTFSFYIVEDTLHLTDFSFNVEIGDVGVKPSGEAQINVDVIANELQKHWSSQNEGMSDKEFSDAQQATRLEKHPEKDMIKKIQALIAKEKGAVSEGPYQTTYIKVAISDYKKAMAILDRAIDPTYTKMDIVDDDGDGNVIIYFNFRAKDDGEPDEDVAAFIYDAAMDLQSRGVNPTGASHDIEETAQAKSEKNYSDYHKDNENVDEIDVNDPVLMKMRAAGTRDKNQGSSSTIERKTKIETLAKIKDLQRLRDQLMRDMEQEAEPEGGPIADDYGRKLNNIDTIISSLKTVSEKAISEDEEEDARNDADDAQGWHDDPRKDEDTDVGHQDDEPSMLKSSAMETAEYAAKLYKKLDKYDQHDGEVDFPNWWQKKLILAREYMSAAYHYIDSEEKQPALDQLALESVLKEGRGDMDTIINLISDKAAESGFSEKEEAMEVMEAIGEHYEISFEYGRMEERVVSDNEPPSIKAKKYADDFMYEYRKMFRIVDGNFGKEAAEEFKTIVKTKISQLQEGQGNEKEIQGQEMVDYIMKTWNWSEDKTLDFLAKRLGDKEETLEEELSGDQREALMDLQNVLDQAAQLGDEARQIVKDHFPRELSAGEAYDVFNFGSSSNSYDKTLESLIGDIEMAAEDDDDDYLEEKKNIVFADSAYDMTVHTMKRLAKKYKAGDKSVIPHLKKLTHIKKQLEKAKINKAANIGKDQEIETDTELREAGPGFAHDCAAKVVHEKYGEGTCIPEQHTLVKEGNKHVVTHYDVLFVEGKKTVKDIPVSELDIKTTNEHWHKGYKKKKK